MKTKDIKEISLDDEKGIKESFRIPLLNIGNVSDIYVPCAIIGKGKGPVVTIISGQHGNEWIGIYICQKLYENLKENDFQGKLVMIPASNPLALIQKSRVSNIDFVDMNRVYSFGKTVKLTHRIAKKIFDNLCLKSDLVIDIHGGGPGEYVPIVEVSTEKDIDLGLSLNLGNLIVLEKEGNGLVTSCIKNGVSSISIEAGKELDINTDYAKLISSGVSNLLKRLKVLKGEEKTKKEQNVFKKKEIISSSETGLFFNKVSLGENVKKDQLIAEIKPLFSDKSTQIISTVNGNIIYLRTQKIINLGESVAHIAMWMKYECN